MTVLKASIVTAAIYYGESTDPIILATTGTNIKSVSVVNGEGDRASSASVVIHDPDFSLAAKLREKAIEYGGIVIPEGLLTAPEVDQTSAVAGTATTGGTIDITNIPDGLKGDELAKAIVAYSIAFAVTDDYWLAAILGTTEIESSMGQFLEEIDDGSNYSYLGSDAPWHGRGLVQLTGQGNYEKVGQLLGVDFIANPDLLTQLKYAIPVLVLGMRDGWFTSTKLSDCGSSSSFSFDQSRDIVNPGEGGSRRQNYISYCQGWLPKIATLKSGSTLNATKTTATATAETPQLVSTAANTGLNQTIAAAVETTIATSNPVDAIVRVFVTPSGGGSDDATGFIINADGTLLTCQHVSLASQGYAILKSGERLDVAFLAQDAGKDIAIGKLPARSEPYPYLSLAPAAGVKVDDIVIAIGMAQSKEPWYTSQGKVTSLTAASNVPTATIATTAGLLEPGNSGCPIFAGGAIVIGMAQAIANGDGTGRIIPVETLRSFLSANGVSPSSTTTTGATKAATSGKTFTAPAKADDRTGVLLVSFSFNYTPERTWDYAFILTSESIRFNPIGELRVEGKGVRSLLTKGDRKRKVWRNISLRQLLDRFAQPRGIQVDFSGVSDSLVDTPISSIAQQGETDLQFALKVANQAGLTIAEQRSGLESTANTGIKEVVSPIAQFLSQEQSSLPKLTAGKIADGTVIKVGKDYGLVLEESIESADESRIVGDGLPEITAIPDGTAIGEGFNFTCSIPYPDDRHLDELVPGAIVELGEDLVRSPYARQYRVKSVSAKWGGTIGLSVELYLPVKVKKTAASTSTTSSSATSGLSGSAAQVPIPQKGGKYFYLTADGALDVAGNNSLTLRFIDNGAQVDSVPAVCGSGNNQHLSDATVMGSYAPISQGTYKLGTADRTSGSWGPGLGAIVIDVLNVPGRSAILIHEDSNRPGGSEGGSSYGTAGCIGVIGAANMAKVADFRDGGADVLEVNWTEWMDAP